MGKRILSIFMSLIFIFTFVLSGPILVTAEENKTLPEVVETSKLTDKQFVDEIAKHILKEQKEKEHKIGGKGKGDLEDYVVSTEPTDGETIVRPDTPIEIVLQADKKSLRYIRN